MLEKQVALITIKKKNYTLPITDFNHKLGDELISITLEDETRLYTGTNNVIIINGDSEIMNAILNMGDFYTPEKDTQGKIKVKKLTKDNSLKLINGGKNE